MIALPGVQMLMQPPLAESVSENRVLAQPPDIGADSFREPKQLIRAVEAYLNDQFGFRESLIYWHSYWMAFYLDRSPSEKTIIGKDDWLFLNSYEMMDDHRGLVGFSEQENDNWREYFETRQQWAQKHGALYIVVIVPEKQTIYPEYLPERYTLVVDDNTRLDHMLELFSDTINMPDLRPALISAKDETQIYRKVDTHWTGYGAFIGYQQIMEIIQPSYPNITVLDEDQLRTVERSMRGDLSNAMGLGDILQENLEDVILSPVRACARELERETLEDRRRALYIEMACPSQTLRLVMFRDSYSNALVPFIAESFGESMYVWDNMSFNLYGDLLEEFQPDVIIEQFAERRISTSEGWFDPPN